MVTFPISDRRRRSVGKDVGNWSVTHDYSSDHRASLIIIRIKLYFLFQLMNINLEPPTFLLISRDSLAFSAVHICLL